MAEPDLIDLCMEETVATFKGRAASYQLRYLLARKRRIYPAVLALRRAGHRVYCAGNVVLIDGERTDPKLAIKMAAELDPAALNPSA